MKHFLTARLAASTAALALMTSAALAEKELRSGLMLYDGSLMPLVTRPISLFFILLTLVLALWPLVQARIKARQATRSEGRQAARPGRG